MSDVIDELLWRGLIAQSTDIGALREAFAAGPVTFYCGFDPTAASLHHGHLVQLLVMRHLQQAGHRPIALVGGATGLIGDPRETSERSLQPREIVAEWAERLRTQISSILPMDGENPARLANNYEWTASLSAIDLLRDIGKHFRLSTMLSKDKVARRLASEEGISYTEFSYQIIQAHDFLQLFDREGCILQTGGNDQWGNLVGGVELIRKMRGESVHVLATPLITKADGTKFGKSEGGAIWLDPQMFSPYAFYQFWLNTDDADVISLLKVFTFLDRATIGELEQAVAERPHAREAQRTLAKEVTELVHGAEATERVIRASAALFGREDIREIDADTLAQATAELPGGEINTGMSMTDVLVAVGAEKGRGAARRTISQGGASLNNEKISDPDALLSDDDVLAGGVVLVRRGRRNLFVGTISA